MIPYNRIHTDTYRYKDTYRYIHHDTCYLYTSYMLDLQVDQRFNLDPRIKKKRVDVHSEESLKMLSSVL